MVGQQRGNNQDYDEQKSCSITDANPVFNYIAENLRNELTKINLSLEYANTTGDYSDLKESQYSTQYMLRLIECYLGYINQPTKDYDIEPVSLSALLTSIASTMTPYANWQQCDLDLDVTGRFQPVMANKELLTTVMIGLSSLFIAAQSEVNHNTRPVISYAVTRSSKGISAGIYSTSEAISAASLRQARALYGKPGNPIGTSVTSGSAGLYMADSILTKMSVGLRVSRHNKMVGLSASFQPSKQLALV